MQSADSPNIRAPAGAGPLANPIHLPTRGPCLTCRPKIPYPAIAFKASSFAISVAPPCDQVPDHLKETSVKLTVRASKTDAADAADAPTDISEETTTLTKSETSVIPCRRSAGHTLCA
ncbi:hypothetical protein S40288_10768 [Stachybotrys chartarum IBT 40288]|nr:hypothetical protein S40288_10768 [Stachybotrys chartarum IBT 40288]